MTASEEEDNEVDGVQEEERDGKETGERRQEIGSLAASTHNEATTRSAHIPSTTCATVSQTLGRAVNLYAPL